MIWFPFYPSDFIGATVGLSCQEVSIYNWMLTLYYELGPFPEDRVRTYRIIRCESDEQKRTVDYLLANHFVLLEGHWWNERAERVREEVERRHSDAALRGKLSAEARRSKYGTAQPKPRDAFERLSKASGKASELTTTTTTTTKEKDKDGASDESDADVWSFGIDLLTREGGLGKGTARSYLGALLKSWDEAMVLDALMASAGKADPKAYARKWLDDKPRKGHKKRSAAEELMEEINERK